jgi:antitoxin YefM
MPQYLKIVHNFVVNYVHNKPKMLTATVSEFRKDIKIYLDQVTENLETLIINRGKKAAIVVVSLAEYNSLMATYHELSSAANRKALDLAVEKIKAGKYFEKDLIEE